MVDVIASVVGTGLVLTFFAFGLITLSARGISRTYPRNK